MIRLAKKYYLVIDEPFELFYRGIIQSHDPYLYYIIAECEKGYTYKRYFLFTPRDGDEGSYTLTIKIIDNEGKIIEEKKTTLEVIKQTRPIKKLNILCIGDSETVNGVWPKVGCQKFEEIDEDSFNFIGKMSSGKIGFEGYGGWQWKTFFFDQIESRTTSLKVYSKDIIDKEWIDKEFDNNGLKWILKEINDDFIIFTRHPSNTSCVNPKVDDKFINNDIVINVTSYEYILGNPFFNPQTKMLDFKYYIQKNALPTPDIIFTFLTGNGLYIPYDDTFSNHKTYAPQFIKRLHDDFPNALIGIMGVEMPCPNGGVTSCYGASGYYHDWYGYACTVFNYDEWLESLTGLLEFKDYTFYLDVKASFDAEFNYPTELRAVNKRSDVYEKIGTNGLHPSIRGYYQIGDIFYTFLTHLVNEYNMRNKTKN